MFEEFNFSILDDSEFKEDSVREEIIVPILKKLGYSAFGENKITRSMSLKHPFVHIGTKSNRVNIIPDYILHIGEEYKWILDAKSPKENILNGKNPEQAFSYAIHPDVRASKYALCNGRHFVVFEISHSEPILDIKISEIDRQWEKVEKCLSPLAFSKPHVLNFKPDYGLCLTKIGITENTDLHFIPMGIPMIAKIEDGLYSIFVNIEHSGEYYATSFYFDEDRYKQLLDSIPSSISEEIKYALKCQPYQISLTENAPEVNISARLGKEILSNDDENYRPLEVVKFD
ncbi:MAG: hypothetical protein VSS75_018245 [Candidatus Parabeggiatoa sp.]|nr:hypothetical protein [Candidatus Parabeggiatoa sp.]